jgi:hypothetical protein
MVGFDSCARKTLYGNKSVCEFYLQHTYHLRPANESSKDQCSQFEVEPKNFSPLQLGPLQFGWPVVLEKIKII